MVDFSALTSCADLTAEMAEQAAGSHSDLAALLLRVAEISRPEDGCPKVLMAVAKCASRTWLEGDLRVEIYGDDTATMLALIYDHGFGIRERVMPPIRLSAPIDEFERAVRIAPKLVAPLAIDEQEPGRLVLVHRSLDGAEPIRVAQNSVVEIIASAAPPDEDEIVSADIDMRPSAVERIVPEADEDGEVVPADIDMREPIAANGPQPMNIHTKPTRRMAVIDPEMLRAATARRDPRRDED